MIKIITQKRFLNNIFDGIKAIEELSKQNIRSRNNISFEKVDYFAATGFEKNNKVLEDNEIISEVDLVSQCRDIFI